MFNFGFLIFDEVADVGMWEGANVGRAPAAGGFCPAFADPACAGELALLCSVSVNLAELRRVAP